MSPAVKLDDLTDALDMMPEELGAWLDRKSGRVLVVETAIIDAVDAGDGAGEPEGLEEWRKEQLPAARGICNGDPRYLALPDKFDFHEYRHMERFIGTVGDARVAEDLWRAIKGKGAFRNFKDTVDRLGVREDWFAYRDQALKRFMLEWAEANEVTVDQSPGRAGERADKRAG